MGLGRHMVEAIIREHRYRPITGDVMTVGRQTVYYTPEQLLDLLRNHGMPLDVDPNTIELDKDTIDRLPGFDPRLVTDVALLRLLGVQNPRALDHSDYEGAQIVHDLRYPLPPNLEGIADFMIDGSTLDNIFTPSTVIQNYAALLKPGGRLLTTNAFSSLESAYVIMTPMWYFDYFVTNGFADCRVYIILYFEDGDRDNVYALDLDFLRAAKRDMGRFGSPYRSTTIVFAEKGDHSTHLKLPNQQDYRSQQEWTEFLEKLDTGPMRSRRPHLVRSLSDRDRTFDPIGRHSFIDRNFRAS